MYTGSCFYWIKVLKVRLPGKRYASCYFEWYQPVYSLSKVYINVHFHQQCMKTHLPKTNTVSVDEPLAFLFLSNIKSFKDYLIHVTAKKFK